MVDKKIGGAGLRGDQPAPELSTRDEAVSVGVHRFEQVHHPREVAGEGSLDTLLHEDGRVAEGATAHA